MNLTLRLCGDGDPQLKKSAGVVVSSQSQSKISDNLGGGGGAVVVVVCRKNQCNNKSLYVQSSPNIRKSKCFCCCTYVDEVDDKNGDDDCPTNFIVTGLCR